jgi:hypothetical protein
MLLGYIGHGTSDSGDGVFGVVLESCMHDVSSMPALRDVSLEQDILWSDLPAAFCRRDRLHEARIAA